MVFFFQSIFSDMLEELYDCEEFVDRATQLIGIWTTAVIAEGEIILRHAETSLEISEATYEK